MLQKKKKYLKVSLYYSFLPHVGYRSEAMPCSAVTLSLATISGVVSAALLAIAVGTDNWQFIRVNRIEIEVGS